MAVRSDSRVWLEGSSNVRDWTCRATVVEATIDIDEGSSDTHTVRGISVRVPVKGLKCGDRHMEAHMYTALKASESQETSFITARFNNFAASTNGEQVEGTGRLKVAGVEREVTMTVRGDKLADGTYRARGSVPILMTDFDIKPPRPWGGILRTANKVVIQFEVFVTP